jgi:formylglycine-generating enzyme required for sulfatase activity
MGSPLDEVGRRKNETMHEVRITRPFYMSVFPITQAQYHKVTRNNQSYFREPSMNKPNLAGLNLGTHPAEMLSWEEAQTFCQRLTEKDRANNLQVTYRLPTEAEWEYACRGGSTSSQPFHLGATLSSTQANYNGEHPYGDGEKGPYLERTSAVGSYPPNAFGLYDMHGNVFEWCADCYDEYEQGPLTDPRGPRHGTGHVIRGGSWSSNGASCRAAYRSRSVERFWYLGFRVVMVPARWGK